QWVPGPMDMAERNGNSASIDPPPVSGFAPPRAPSSSEALDKSSVTTFWLYEGCPVIAFRGMRTYATSYTRPEDGRTIDSMVRAMPAMWRNALDVTVTEMPR